MMLKAPLFKHTAIIYVIALASFSSCLPDDTDLAPCQTIDYGQVSLMFVPGIPFPFHDGEALIFKDSLQHELRMEMDPSGLSSNYTLETGTSSSSLCKGGIKTIVRQQYIQTQFHSDTSKYELYCSFQVNRAMVNDTARFYDGVFPSVREVNTPIDSWMVYLSYVSNARGNEGYMFHVHSQYADIKNLNGKDFFKVYSNYNSDGSEIHFNQELGFVAFRKEHGTLWVLDRTE